MISFGDLFGIVWLVPVLLLTILWIRTPIFVSARGKRVLLWLKLGILGLLVLALIDPKIETRSFHEEFGAIFAIDVSPSVDPDSLAGAFRSVAGLCADLPDHVVPQFILFSGNQAAIERLPEDWKTEPTNEDVKNFLRGVRRESSTDLGGALLESMKALPAGRRGRIYLFSDGCDTHGDVGQAVQSLSDANLPVSVVPLEVARIRSRPQIIKCVFPDRVFPGEEFAARILISNPGGGSLTLELRGTDRSIFKEEFSSPEGLSARTLKITPKTRGVIGYSVRVLPSGEPQKAAQYLSTVTVRPLPRALIFEEDNGDGKLLREILANEKIEFATFSPASWPADFATAIQPYPCIILNNIPRKRFKDSDLETLRRNVRNGSGLLMVGGPNSFGLGEYTETPMEDLLPVRLPRRTVNQQLALVLVLDASGSMFGESWDYLIAATKEILQLCKGQYVGIIMFNHLPSWVLPVQQIDELGDIFTALDQYYPGGGTVFSLPLAQALVALKDLPFDHKNVIMLSDGIPSDFNFVTPLYENFREFKVSVTTIAAGSNVNSDNLRNIADETGGEFYTSPDFAELPQIFRKEFKRISAPPFIEENFKPVLTEGTTFARGITQAEIPALDGLVITQKKDKAVMVMASNRGDPVLTYWRFGLGRSAAFTSDLLPNWSRKWASWNGLGKLIRQSIKELSEGVPERFSLETTQKGSDLHIFVQPGSTEKAVFRFLQATDTASRSHLLPLTLGSDGRYEAVMRNTPPGMYVAEVLTDSASRVGATLAATNESQEFRAPRMNLPLLRQIADQTGGEVIEDGGQLSMATIPVGRKISTFVPLWPWLVIFALLLFLIDIYLRRAGVFGLHERSGAKTEGGEAQGEIYLQLGQKFSNLAEEHSLRGEEEEAKRYYLRAKAFFMKAKATQEAHQMWERYKRFESR